MPGQEHAAFVDPVQQFTCPAPAFREAAELYLGDLIYA